MLTLKPELVSEAPTDNSRTTLNAIKRLLDSVPQDASNANKARAMERVRDIIARGERR